MAHIPLKKHSNHQIEIRQGQGPHQAQYWCKKCNKHIAWISKTDYQLLKDRNYG